MATTIIPDEGQMSPEYVAVKKNFGPLKSVLDLPANRSTAYDKLIESGMINLSDHITGEVMVTSVLKQVAVQVTKFYTFVSILQRLTDTGKVLNDLQQQFCSKEVNTI